MRRQICFLGVWLPLTAAVAGTPPTVRRDFTPTQTYEMQYSQSSGSTPLWLHSNRYGLSSLDKSNGYVRAMVKRDAEADSLYRWAIGYGADLAATLHYTSHYVVQQLYVDVRYKRLWLTVGQKAHAAQLRDNLLSSGAQALGINARPVPGVRLEVPQYWDVPGTHEWLALRGHLFFGKMTDDAFQRDFTHEMSHYNESTLLHTKAGYVRIGHEKKSVPVTLELGLEMACEFGGRHYNLGTTKYLQASSSLKAYWQAFIVSGNDEIESVYSNVAGNHLGSWLARLTYYHPAFTTAVYLDHYFEDHSAMLFADYDGYGTGSDWQQRVESRYLAYGMHDFQLGLEVQPRHCKYLQSVVAEFIDTRYQSGPIYHDHHSTLSDHVGGADNYYNHTIYAGWVHWGEVMGNPLYRSPLYNTNHSLMVADNRFYAWHFGARGQVTRRGLGYRVLLTWQKGYGSYSAPLLAPAYNRSFLAECVVPWDNARRHTTTFALGGDRGGLLGSQIGAQCTYTFHFDPSTSSHR